MAQLVLRRMPALGIIHVPAALWSGVIAGVIFLLLEMALSWLFLGAGAWRFPTMAAAIALGSQVLPALGEAYTFNGSVVLTGLVVHLMLSLVYATAFGFLYHRLSTGAATALGGVLGLVLYFLNYYGFAMAFEWFIAAQDWVSVLAHIVFGLLVAWTYQAIQMPEAAPPESTIS